MSDAPDQYIPMKQEVEQFHERMKKLQEPKGYQFNKDDGHTLLLLEQLLIIRKRYGYMACPCRFANGSRELDKDIICPCVYRADDIKEYGSCFCGLYVSPEWNGGTLPHVYVPERRSPDKIIF